MIERSRAAGFFSQGANVEKLEKDPDLDALRQRDEFRTLIEELKKSASENRD